MNRTTFVFGVLACASLASAQLQFQEGSGNFQDIAGLPGTIELFIPFNGSTVVTTSIGNDVFPAGDIKVSYGCTIASNVGASEAVGAYETLPSPNLYDQKTAMAIIWDTPNPAVATTQFFFREFTNDPTDIYYIVQWNNVPMGGLGGTVTTQVRVNDVDDFRTNIFAVFSYQDVQDEGVEGGRFASIGYQSASPEFPTVQWSFNQRNAVRNQGDLILTKIPAPGSLGVLALGALACRRRRAKTV
ncbi:MAG: hypothetical protein SFY69_09565 [Planctomycetota bacterium]|nr:hypothetical protein [Planctomycetota bacterium]